MTPTRRRRRRSLTSAVALAAVLVIAGSACSDVGSSKSAAQLDTSKDTGPVAVRLGYFANVTHAPAVIGVKLGLFAKALGTNTLEPHTFNAGPAEVEQFLADNLDIGYIGPNPAINAWQKTQGEGGKIRIIAGSSSGGAALVVKPEITSPAQLKGASLASPQLGGTQDVALRSWLKSVGYNTDTSGGGDVSIKPQENADTLTAFKDHKIDGAWVPEPWASRLEQEGGGHILVDESTLWPEGKFVTTTIIVRTAFLNAHPDVVKKFLQGHLDALDELRKNPTEARQATNDGIKDITSKALSDGVIKSSFDRIDFTEAPLASALNKVADSATAVGLLSKVDLKGIYDLRVLNELLTAAGKPAASET